jgi:hypothetical protein
VLGQDVVVVLLFFTGLARGLSFCRFNLAKMCNIVTDLAIGIPVEVPEIPFRGERSLRLSPTRYYPLYPMLDPDRSSPITDVSAC